MAGQLVGFRDFQRTAEQAGTVVASITGQNINANPVTGIFDTTGYTFMNVNIVASATAIYIVQIVYYADQAGTQPIFAKNWIPTPGANMCKLNTVVSRWAQVVTSFVAGTGTEQPSIYVFGTNANRPLSGAAVTAAPLLYSQPAINAGATVTVGSLETYEGPVYWTTASSGNGMWIAFLQYYDWVSKTYLTFATRYGATQGQADVVAIALPAAPVQIVVKNTDTVAHTFQMCLLIDQK